MTCCGQSLCSGPFARSRRRPGPRPARAPCSPPLRSASRTGGCRQGSGDAGDELQNPSANETRRDYPDYAGLRSQGPVPVRSVVRVNFVVTPSTVSLRPRPQEPTGCLNQHGALCPLIGESETAASLAALRSPRFGRGCSGQAQGSVAVEADPARQHRGAGRLASCHGWFRQGLDQRF